MSFLGGLAKVAGGVGGFMLGGPAGAMAGYSLGSSLGGAMDGHGGGGNPMEGAARQQGQYATQDRNRYLQALGGGQDAVNQSTQAAVSNAMPSFMKNLQGTREDAIRRGASNGDLATSYEGDLTSAFQRNIANGAGAQAANVWGQTTQGYGNLAQGSQNNYLDLLAGNRDADQANSNNKYGLAGSLLGAAGQAAGAYYGKK